MRNAAVAAILFLLSTRSLYGFDIALSGAAVGIEAAPEYSRVYGGCITVSAAGSLEFNERCTLAGGIALWKARTAYELDAAAAVEVKLLRALPLYASLSYQFNTLPDYEARSHTALPLLAFRGKYAGITLGTNFRFSSFFDEPPIFESILAFELYVNFYNGERFRIGLRCANFNELAAGNFGAYYLCLNSRVALTPFLSLLNDLGLYQTGSAGLAFEMYSIAYTAGLVFTW